jgi:hypothetical protein
VENRVDALPRDGAVINGSTGNPNSGLDLAEGCRAIAVAGGGQTAGDWTQERADTVRTGAGEGEGTQRVDSGRVVVRAAGCPRESLG